MLADTSGSVSVLTAILAVVIILFCGFAVDTASLAFAKRKLQAAVDAAALAAVHDTGRASDIVAASLVDNGFAGATVLALDIGSYTDDPNLAPLARFTPGAGSDAVFLRAQTPQRLFFLQIATGNSEAQISAEATAHLLPAAGMAIGTGTADADTAVVNEAVEEVAGFSPSFTDSDVDALDAVQVDLFRALDAMAAQTGGSGPIQEITSRTIGWQQLASALFDALNSQLDAPVTVEVTALNVLQDLSLTAPGGPAVSIGDFLSVDVHAEREPQDLLLAGRDRLSVPLYALLRGYLTAAGEADLLTLTSVAGVPGVANITAEAAVVRPELLGGPGGTPVVAVGPVGTRAASGAARVRITASLLSPVTVLGQSLNLSVPLIVEAGYGEAEITGLTCGPDLAASTQLEITGTSGLLRLSVGSVDDSDLSDFSTPLAPGEALLADIGLISIAAAGTANILPSEETVLIFSLSEIAAGTEKPVEPSLGLGAAINLLEADLALDVDTALPLPGAEALIVAAVEPVLGNLLTELGPIIEELLASLGLRAGYMDVRGLAAQCGQAVLSG